MGGRGEKNIPKRRSALKKGGAKDAKWAGGDAPL